MSKMAVIRTGGKQFLVRKDEEIVVDKLETPVNENVELEVLGIFDGEDIEIGTPVLDKKVKAQIMEHMKGDKLHVYKFKSKVRYRRKMGFRPQLTRIKIGEI